MSPFQPHISGPSDGGAGPQAPSYTAVLVCQGRASVTGRYASDRFTDDVARTLLDPPERAVVDVVRAGSVPDDPRARVAYELVRRTGLVLVPRTVAIDEFLRCHRTPQVVIIGAGLDARAWRMPELSGARVYELDHPASQRDKLRRVAQRRPVARRVVPVAADLSAGPFADELLTAGFRPHEATVWVCEGVIPYLTPPQVRGVLSQIRRLSGPGSWLIANYQTHSLRDAAIHAAARVALRAAGQANPLQAEPWRSVWRVRKMRNTLRRQGFQVVSDDHLLALSAGMALPSEVAPSLRGGRIAVASPQAGPRPSMTRRA